MSLTLGNKRMYAEKLYSKEIFTNTLRLRLLKNGIIHYTYIASAEVDEEDHLANHKALLEIAEEGKKYPLLVDSEEFIVLTPEAQRLVRKLEPLIPVTCRALVVKSMSQRILSNFYIKFHKPYIPTHIFATHKEALEWIESRKES